MGLQFMRNSRNACFQEVDVDGSGSLSYKELCMQLRKLDFTPPIHITMIDYDVITQVKNAGLQWPAERLE